MKAKPVVRLVVVAAIVLTGASGAWPSVTTDTSASALGGSSSDLRLPYQAPAPGRDDSAFGRRAPASEQELLGFGQEAFSGAELTEALGCGVCHEGVPTGDAIRGVAPPLGLGGASLAPAYIFHYLADPRSVRPDIWPVRMPAYDLDERERVALALFSTNEGELRGVDEAFLAARDRFPETDREEGKALFKAFNCAGCHVHAEAEPRRTAPDLGVEGVRAREEWVRAYLSDPVTIRPAGSEPGQGGQMPDFRFTPAELDTLTRFLMDRTGGEVAPWDPQTLSPFAMQKAETLLRDRWSCLGCHQLGSDGGRIGPRLDGIAHRLQPGYVRALVQDPASLVPGTMMPGSFEQPDRMDLIVSFLFQREAAWSGSEAVASPAPPLGREDVGIGGVLYGARCAPCHGLEGGGDGFNAPFLPVPPAVLGDAETMSKRPDDTLYDGIFAGAWVLGKSHRMPAFGPSLNDGEIRALVAYIRELCECLGPAWSRDGRRR